MKVIVTGATGMIGIHLIKKLIDEGCYVYAIAHKNSKRIGRIPNSSLVKVIECDLCDLKELPQLINNKVDTFYHLAWDGTFGNSRDELDSQINNIKYSVDAVRCASKLGCSVFIGAGSQAEYGRTNVLLNANVPCFPENGYGMAKLCAGEMTRLECQKLGMRHVWCRILSVYGPFDGEKTLISYIIKNLLQNNDVDLTEGKQIWDYMYVKDCVNAIYKLSVSDTNNKVYCLGSGVGKPLKEYVECIKKIIGSTSTINYGAIPYSSKQVMHLVADLKDLKNDVNFEINYCFENGIKETIDYWKEALL